MTNSQMTDAELKTEIDQLSDVAAAIKTAIDILDKMDTLHLTLINDLEASFEKAVDKSDSLREILEQG